MKISKALRLVVCAASFGLAATAANAAPVPLVNGDFEAGATGFVTDYNLEQVFLGAGDYWVDDSDLFGWNNGVGDHTTGSGNMAMYNGAATPGAVLWGQTVDLVAGVTYEFFGWVKTLNLGAPTLEFFADGVSAGTFDAPQVADEWFSFSFVFTASSTGSTLITLVNNNLNPAGVDFALDDFQLNSQDNVVTPLPAALPLFLSALGIGGFVTRRRKKAAA